MMLNVKFYFAYYLILWILIKNFKLGNFWVLLLMNFQDVCWWAEWNFFLQKSLKNLILVILNEPRRFYPGNPPAFDSKITFQSLKFLKTKCAYILGLAGWIRLKNWEEIVENFRFFPIDSVGHRGLSTTTNLDLL